jgi:hypothetical protein
MSNRDICAYVGITETTFYEWLLRPSRKQEVKFSESLKKAETAFKQALRQKILKHTDDSWQAAAWLLERQYPEEYARPEIQMNIKSQVEHQSTEDPLSKSLRELGENL